MEEYNNVPLFIRDKILPLMLQDCIKDVKVSIQYIIDTPLIISISDMETYHPIISKEHLTDIFISDLVRLGFKDTLPTSRAWILELDVQNDINTDVTYKLRIGDAFGDEIKLVIPRI